MATQGLLKTAISVASNEVKDNFTKGIKEGLSEYIAKDLLDKIIKVMMNKEKKI
ncbi:hypothetical protein [Campylobacter concisus]|uniref:hypothetical protein n=1 Tax=Campylobacter concisus TaxID=199 RepID=UPI0015E1AA6A|nr:hypothetical protein [Campylobacter concisus]